ncbi:putative cyclic-di-GMP phosphodiesterase AdrB [compost metagenome]
MVAEGVETAAQLAFLRSNGCESYQGWWFAKALPAVDISRMLGGASSPMGFEQRHFS